MWGIFLIIAVTIGVCWSEGKKAWAAEEAKHINANRPNPYRPPYKRK